MVYITKELSESCSSVVLRGGQARDRGDDDLSRASQGLRRAPRQLDTAQRRADVSWPCLALTDKKETR